MQATNAVTMSAMNPKNNTTIVLLMTLITFAAALRLPWAVDDVLAFADERKMAGAIKINKRIAKLGL